MKRRELVLGAEARLENVRPIAAAVRAACGVGFDDPPLLERLELCVVEAATNAARHGPPGGRVEIRLELEDETSVEVEIRDQGRCYLDAMTETPAIRAHLRLDDLPESRRGLFLIRGALPGARYRRDGGWNVLRFGARLREVPA